MVRKNLDTQPTLLKVGRSKKENLNASDALNVRKRAAQCATASHMLLETRVPAFVLGPM
jgi:hypothetical protein